MHPRYPNIFSPIRLGPIELRNRFYSSPHAVPMTIGSKPSDDYIHYNVARVKDGGCGLVMLTMTMHFRGRSFQPSPHPKENIPAFRALADAVHEAGGKIFGEPWYFWGAAGQWQPLSPPAPAFTPSVAQFSIYEKGVATREMTTREIGAMIEAFGQSTANLCEAGFDGVMVHASHGALAEQFLSPYFNRRTDDYGGPLENRMRFLIESLQAARDGAGGKMAVGMRLNCDELLSGGYGTKDAYQILKTVSASGLIDYADLDIAVEPNQLHLGMPSVFVEPQIYRPYVEAVRSAAGKIPVLSVLGRTTSIAEAEAAIAAGVCDMVGAARALIAEPELVKNAFEGKEEQSRICIACNWCLASLYDGAMSCAINPTSFRERYWGTGTLVPAPRRSKVVVVGAGPGGLEAARVGALRGHDVTLFEARDKLGGAFALWAMLPGREFYRTSIDWWARELKRLGVRILPGTMATAPGILREKPDAVILATGARYSASGRGSYRDFDIPGYDRDFVYRPEEILLGTVRPAGKIVLLDNEGLHAGVGMAELLAGRGGDVELLTPGFAPLSPRIIGAQETRPIMERLRSAGVRISPMSYIKEIGDHEVTVQDVYSAQERTIIGIDAVVLSTGRVSVNALEKELDGKVAQLFTVGDALAARMWAAASFEGHKFARYIGEPGAPRSVGEVYFGADDPVLLPIAADRQRASG
jgi:2,4-dienoyl-CoA reductase-like NADH-dependent reductase (Old Yellow Enzyme family)